MIDIEKCLEAENLSEFVRLCQGMSIEELESVQIECVAEADKASEEAAALTGLSDADSVKTRAEAMHDRGLLHRFAGWTMRRIAEARREQKKAEHLVLMRLQNECFERVAYEMLPPALFNAIKAETIRRVG